jgi:hypothetical protein
MMPAGVDYLAQHFWGRRQGLEWRGSRTSGWFLANAQRFHFARVVGVLGASFRVSVTLDDVVPMTSISTSTTHALGSTKIRVFVARGFFIQAPSAKGTYSRTLGVGIAIGDDAKARG